MTETRWHGHDGDDRRARILVAAQQVFAERGYHVAEVQDIAVVAGVSKATIYKVFRSKDEILLTIVDDNFRQLREIVLASLAQPVPPLRLLRNTLYAAARHLDEHKAFCRVLVRDGGEFLGEIRRHYGELMREHTPLAEAFFEHLRQRGEIPPVATPDLLKILTNAGIGILYAWVLTDEGRLVDQVDFYFDLFDRVMPQWRAGMQPAAADSPVP